MVDWRLIVVSNLVQNINKKEYYHLQVLLDIYSYSLFELIEILKSIFILNLMSQFRKFGTVVTVDYEWLKQVIQKQGWAKVHLFVEHMNGIFSKTPVCKYSWQMIAFNLYNTPLITLCKCSCLFSKPCIYEWVLKDEICSHSVILLSSKHASILYTILVSQGRKIL